MNSRSYVQVFAALWLVFLVVALHASCSATNSSLSEKLGSERTATPEWADTPVGKAVRTGSGVDAPAVRSRVNPNYPDTDLQARRQGLVRMEVVIDEKGKVIHTQVLEAPSPSLGFAASDAVRNWTFAQTSVAGQPVRVLMPIAINFKLP